MKLETLNKIFKVFGFYLIIEVHEFGAKPTLIYFISAIERARRVRRGELRPTDKELYNALTTALKEFAEHVRAEHTKE